MSDEVNAVSVKGIYKNYGDVGPSGCGKSTLIRCFNRMNDLIPSAIVEGDVKYNETSPKKHIRKCSFWS